MEDPTISGIQRQRRWFWRVDEEGGREVSGGQVGPASQCR